MSSDRLLVLLVTVLIGGCGDNRDSDSTAELRGTSLPGVYAGAFPCENCPSIQTTLWLRSDGRFFIRQTYPEDNGLKAMSAYNLGRWSWIANDRMLVLNGAGPRRMFTRPDLETLVMRSESDLEHRLARDPAAANFSSRIRMAGMMSMRGDSTSFTECLTRYVAPVEKGGDFARFLHQYRSVGANGEPAYVEFEGHFSWSRDGTLKSFAIDRFIAVKSTGAC